MKKEHLATGKETDGCGHRRREMDLWVWQQRGVEGQMGVATGVVGMCIFYERFSFHLSHPFLPSPISVSA